MNKVEIVNLTRTPLKFLDVEGNLVTIQSSGEARLDIQRVKSRISGFSNGSEIKVNDTQIVSYKGLPKEKEGVVFVVPSIVYQALYHTRKDIYIIDEPFKQNGAIVHAKSIARPLLKSMKEEYRKISDLVTAVSNNINDESKVHSNKESITEKLFEIKKLTDKYL